jgi:type IV fimbrial biogenesis protein FimT
MDQTHLLGAHNDCIDEGFTLIELLVTIAIAGILTAIAVPAFNNYIMNDRDIGQINSLVSGFNYARSEAIKRDVQSGITVCPSVNGTTCSGTAWAAGWIVIDGVAGDPPLSNVPAFAGSNTVTATGSPTGVTFLSSGMVTAAMTIKICDVRGASFARDVEINAAGRVAASQTPGKSVAGTALVCP